MKITSISNNDSEIYIAGGKIDRKYSPFYVDQNEVQKVQYGSDETKTHRKIYHLLGKNGEGRSGRLLVVNFSLLEKVDGRVPSSQARYGQITHRNKI